MKPLLRVRIWYHDQWATASLELARRAELAGDRPRALWYAMKHLEHLEQVRALEQVAR